MPLLPSDEEWRATIEGAPHLGRHFWMPAGATESQARYRAWEIWSHARAGGSTPQQPVAAQGLKVERIGVAMRALADLPVAA